MITPAKDIEFIVSLYPNPLRTIHTVFQLDIEGATFPFFLHSQVAFALIQISQSKGEVFIAKYISHYIQEKNSQSFVVLDDGELLDFQIICTLWALQNYKQTQFFDINPIDNTQLINMIWEENIDITIVNSFIDLIETKYSQLSKNYIICDQYVVKMPQIKVDNNSVVMLNMIFEKQIKRLFECFYRQNLPTIVDQNIDIYVISDYDQSLILNYASISAVNNTLDTIVDPIDFEYWIIIILDYLTFLHRNLHIVSLDIRPENIFIGNKYQLNKNLEKVLSIDLGSALILDLGGERQYFVQTATKEYCSPNFWNAFIRQTPLSAQELIQEDHYQILGSLDDVCQGRKDLTRETEIILEILRSTKTIEDAISQIFRKLELIHKVFSRLMNSELEVGYFAISFLRNLDPEGLEIKPLKSIELLLQREPYDLAKQLLDYTMSYLYPIIFFKDEEKEFRQQFRILSIICNMQWLSPLLVLIDYLESYQDQKEEEISKQLKLLEETIFKLSVSDQKKIFCAIKNGFHFFLLNCKQHSVANWFYFSNHIIKNALQLTELSDQERKMLIILDEKYQSASSHYDKIQVVPAFRKKSLIPYDFIARHSYPKGLFQVFLSDSTHYFLCLTCEPYKFYREINEQQLIEVPCLECMVVQYDDRQIILADRDGDIKIFKNDNKLLRIELSKANESARACFIQVAGEPWCYLITGLEIQVQNIESDVQRASSKNVKNKCDQTSKDNNQISEEVKQQQQQLYNLSESGASNQEMNQSQRTYTPMQTIAGDGSAFELVSDSYIPDKSRAASLEIENEKDLSEIQRKPENDNLKNVVQTELAQCYSLRRESLKSKSKSRINLPGFQAIVPSQDYYVAGITENRKNQGQPNTDVLRRPNISRVTQSQDKLSQKSNKSQDKGEDMVEEK